MIVTRQAPTVYVLVVNWNGKHHLESCLPTLACTRSGSFHVVVIDNGSTDGSQTWLQAEFPEIQLLSLGRNLGFAEANNIGMRHAIAAGADYVVLLNNDTRVEPDWLDALVEVAEANSSAAICQAQQRTWDGQLEVHFQFIPEWVEGQAIETPLQAPGSPARTAYATGCGMLLRCSALEHIGLFDGRYFAYVEDVDLSLRAWIAGYEVMRVPQSVIYHRGWSSSTSKQRMFWGYRNQLTTLLKLYQVETLRRFAEPIRDRWFLTRNRIALRGTLASLAMLPETMKRRAIVQRERVAPDSVFLSTCQNW